MPVILALAQKDLRILLRLKTGLFFTFAWPLVVAVLFGTIFSNGDASTTKTKVVVADEDGSPAAAEFVSRLQKDANLDVVRVDRNTGLSLVRKGERTGTIVVPRGFGDAAGRMFYGTPPKVELWIDPSHKAESAMLQGILFKHGAERMQSVMSNTSVSRDMVRTARERLQANPAGDPRGGETERFLAELDRYLGAGQQTGQSDAMGKWNPLDVDEKPVVTRQAGPFPNNAYDFTFPQGILWGIIGCVMTFGLGIVTERSQGTMVRLQMSPISHAQLLGGKALACFSAIAIVEVSLFIVGRVFFGVHPASWLLLVLAALSAAIGFVGIMMLISALGKTEQAAAGAGWAVMMPLTLLGGGMVPLFAMPHWMATAGNISPAKWAVVAFEGAIWRGFSLSEMLLPCGILLAVGVVCFAVGTRAFRAAA